MGLADGDLYISGSILSFQQMKRIYQNFRGATVPSNLQAGALWSDSDDDKLYHKGASLFEVHTGATTMYKWAKGGDIVSSAALDISALDGNYFDITGANAITSITASGRTGTVICLHFDAALTLTHHATDLALPSEANITTAAGDEAIFVEYDTGKWRCINYSRADGTAIVGAADKISEGDSSVEVIDAGTGYIETKADNSQVRKDAVLGNLQALQPAFFAYNSGNQANVTGDETWVQVAFDSEIFDQGGNFASGIFTAPITGRYLLTTLINFDDIDSDVYETININFVTSNRTFYGYALDPTNYDSGGELRWNLSLVVDMDANDTALVNVMVRTGTKTVDIRGAAAADILTSFSGVLLC